MAALPPQPDFALLAQKMQDISASFGDTSEHFQRCQNLPAVTGTARLEQLIQTMMETTQAQFRAIQTDVAGLRTQLTQVDERVQRLDAKSDAMSTKLITMYVHAPASLFQTDHPCLTGTAIALRVLRIASR